MSATPQIRGGGAGTNSQLAPPARTPINQPSRRRPDDAPYRSNA